MQRCRSALRKTRKAGRMAHSSKICTGVMGPIPSTDDIRYYMSGIDDESEESEEPKCYMNSYWWATTPCGPSVARIEPGLLTDFRDRFSSNLKGLVKWPRLDVEHVLHRPASTTFFRTLLEGRFGRAANQLTPEEFSSELQRIKVDHRTYLRDAYGSDAVRFPTCRAFQRIGISITMEL
jgi:hypothetical protein